MLASTLTHSHVIFWVCTYPPAGQPTFLPAVFHLYPPTSQGYLALLPSGSHAPLPVLCVSGCWMNRHDGTASQAQPWAAPWREEPLCQVPRMLYRGSDCQRRSGQRRERAFQAERTVEEAMKCQGFLPAISARTSCVFKTLSLTPLNGPPWQPVRPE